MSSLLRRSIGAAAVIFFSDFLARNGWKAEGRAFIVSHGGCGSCGAWRSRALDGFDTQSVRDFMRLRHIRHAHFAQAVNKM
jgi:hypothetical protein